MNPRPDQTAFLVVTPAMRKRLEATIESLIALMDEIAGDPDLEETGDDEESLGWTERGPGSLGSDGGDDREADDSDDEDGGDSEPTLGSIGSGSAGLSQQWWAAGAGDEREEDDDHEPLMGWSERCSQGPTIGMDMHPCAFDGDGAEISQPLEFTGDGNREAKQLLRLISTRNRQG
jgi:hypothetical protein